MSETTTTTAVRGEADRDLACEVADLAARLAGWIEASPRGLPPSVLLDARWQLNTARATLARILGHVEALGEGVTR